MTVVKLDSFRQKKQSKVSKPEVVETYSGHTFTEMMNTDIQNLAKATGITHEEAIKMAGDFYRRYPMLVEYVRSPEYLLRKDK